MRAFALAVALTTAAFTAQAQTPPPAASQGPAPAPIEAFSLERIGQLGQAIYVQDTAAWKATDALIARHNGQPPAGLAGWVVTPEGGAQRVRFVRMVDGNPAAGWDVVVLPSGTAAIISGETPAPLTEAEQAQFRARQTAAAAIGPHCTGRGGYNAIVLKDPDSTDWFVWLLAPTSDINVIPVGGHVRFRVSEDGRTVRRRDALSTSCLTIQRPPEARGDRAVGMMASHIVSDTPVETHVFLSLQNRQPFYVSAGDKFWSVDGPRIREVRPPRR
jgi:hypothetical protein